jgi:hypothetical protein
VAVDDDAKFNSEAMRIPAVIIALHGKPFESPRVNLGLAKVCQRWPVRAMRGSGAAERLAGPREDAWRFHLAENRV